MFVLKKYGIVLQRLIESDVELVRQWRNDPHIRKNMAYRKHINEAQQKKWFASINNAYNYYFLIIYQGEKIGVINAKNYDPQTRIGEGGIFIWQQRYWDSPVPTLASLVLLEAVFEQLDIIDKSVIRIMSNNIRAIRYNRLLGYVRLPGQEHQTYQFYILTKEDYLRKAARLKRAAHLYSNDFSEFESVGSVSALNFPAINAYLERHGNRQ